MSRRTHKRQNPLPVPAQSAYWLRHLAAHGSDWVKLPLAKALAALKTLRYIRVRKRIAGTDTLSGKPMGELTLTATGRRVLAHDKRERALTAERQQTRMWNPARRRRAEVQSIRFERERWTVREAKRWLREHGHRAPAVDRGRNWYLFRQADPSDFDPRSFRTKRWGRGTGIQAVVARRV